MDSSDCDESSESDLSFTSEDDSYNPSINGGSDSSDLDNASTGDSSDPEIDSSDEDESDDDSNTWNEIDQTVPLDPPPQRFHFTGISSINFQVDVRSPLGIFTHFFDANLLDIIVTETNRFANQTMQQTPRIPRHSRMNQWVPTSADEVMTLLAALILQGVIKKPTEESYWSKRPILATPFFGNLISYRRFILLKRFLHFADNEDFDEESHPSPKLKKIWPVFDLLNQKFTVLYTPERDVSVDESLMLFTGRLRWRQYLPLKRARFGVKSFMLCESKSGYMCKMLIYTGKGTLYDYRYEDFPMTTQIVLTLAHHLLNKGYCITCDNYYSSPELADYLNEHDTDFYGTVRPNRKDMPPELKDKHLEVGEVSAFQRGKLLALKWRDKKFVNLLSTIHNAEMVELNTKSKGKKMKPCVVVDYNDTMGGVDLVDQNLTDYHITRKRGKKYYKKIFMHLVDIAIWNSFILFKKSGGKLSHLEFRLKMVEEMVHKHHSPVAKGGRPRVLPSPMRLTERHFPAVKKGDKSQYQRRRCVVCSSNKVSKRSIYSCIPCDVGLCITPCFEIYHTKEVF